MPEIYRKQDAHHWPRQGVLLFLLPLPVAATLVVALSRGNGALIFGSGIALGLLVAGAILNRSGLRAEAEFHRRKIATAPRTPRKTLAAVLVAAGTAATSLLAAGQGLWVAGSFAGLAFLGAVLAYGRDPRGAKGDVGGAHGYSVEEIIATVEEAEGKLAAIDAASRGIPNLELTERLQRITSKGREILQTLQDDPGDIRRARKFLVVYLDGARNVTEGYAKTRPDENQAELADNFRKVLETIETVFTEQHEKLQQDDLFDLDVQIEVLTKQLEREGVI